MNRRDLFRRIGGAFAAAALELGNTGFIKELETTRVRMMGQWMEVGVWYEWRGDRWEKEEDHAG